MQINRALLLKLQDLANLELTEEELAEFEVDLNKILKMVEKIQEVDTSQTEPLSHITEAKNVFRKDDIKNQLERKDALKNAPNHDGKYFKVPKIIKK